MAGVTYKARAASTEMPGRVLCSTRNHHIIVDGPVTNGFPGEEITPSELFLSAVAACGVELVQMVAQKEEVPLTALSVDIEGLLDRSNPVRTDRTVFNQVRLVFHLKGVTAEQGQALVGEFQRR